MDDAWRRIVSVGMHLSIDTRDGVVCKRGCSAGTCASLSHAQHTRREFVFPFTSIARRVPRVPISLPLSTHWGTASFQKAASSFRLSCNSWICSPSALGRRVLAMRSYLLGKPAARKRKRRQSPRVDRAAASDDGARTVRCPVPLWRRVRGCGGLLIWSLERWGLQVLWGASSEWRGVETKIWSTGVRIAQMP